MLHLSLNFHVDLEETSDKGIEEVEKANESDESDDAPQEGKKVFIWSQDAKNLGKRVRKINSFH
jgi:hypothetical protein